MSSPNSALMLCGSSTAAPQPVGCRKAMPWRAYPSCHRRVYRATQSWFSRESQRRLTNRRDNRDKTHDSTEATASGEDAKPIFFYMNDVLEERKVFLEVSWKVFASIFLELTFFEFLCISNDLTVIYKIGRIQGTLKMTDLLLKLVQFFVVIVQLMHAAPTISSLSSSKPLKFYRKSESSSACWCIR